MHLYVTGGGVDEGVVLVLEAQLGEGRLIGPVARSVMIVSAGRASALILVYTGINSVY